ncbi:MAG: NADH-quinone oxidoreductase subunit M [Pseudomonadota bacterium]|nr:NADH-quinone oxidoreductase subunit M [Pseudomonadota bacterium]
MGLLSVLIWLPISGGLLLLILGQKGEVFRLDRWLALGLSTLTFFLSLPLYLSFDLAVSEMQWAERFPWIEAFSIYYHLGVDGISVPLILLSTFLTPFIIIAGWESIKQRPSQYFAAFLMLEGLMIGVFASLDAILFYVFWEAMLIPMFLIIGVWGGERRVYATLKFFLYTFLGSVLMLVALIYMYLQAGSYGILDFYQLPLNKTEQLFIFFAFLFAFAVKVPMWPVHTWLPDAHVEAPTGGSVILAAVLLKMGGYGFIRFSLPITPDASSSMDLFMIILSLIAVVYIGLVALAQTDLKKLIAYSSIAHMGFVTLGLFIAWRILLNGGTESGVAFGLTGAMVQMISHGLISGALFLCVGVLYDRMHSRDISDYGGVVNTMPRFAALMVFFALANAGLPGTSGFVGEFLVILASFQAGFWYAFFAATTLILGAAYTLWMVKRVVFGEIANDRVNELTDINQREFFLLAALAVCILGLGVYPQPLVEIMEPSINVLIGHITQTKL